MISNEERREVACRIRQLDQRGRNNLFSTCLNCGKWLGAVYGDEDYCAEKPRRFSDCLEIKNALAARIADLIDRPTCQMVECTIDHGSRSWGMRCTACGKEFEHMKPSWWHNCPNCGAEVVE